MLSKKKASTSKKSSTSAKKSSVVQSKTDRVPNKQDTRSNNLSSIYLNDQVVFVYDIQDFDRAKKWYTEILELKEAVYFPEIGWYEIKTPIPNCHIGFGPNRNGKPVIPVSSFSLTITNLDAAIEIFQKKNVKIGEIQDVPDQITTCDIYDSEGNIIRLLTSPRVITKPSGHRTGEIPPKGKNLSEYYNTELVYLNINVKDIYRAKKFYTEILGLEAGYDVSDMGWAEVKKPVTVAHIGLNVQKDGDIKKGSGQLTLTVKDLAKAKTYFQSKGIKIYDEYDIPNAISMFSIDDTEGNPITFTNEMKVPQLSSMKDVYAQKPVYVSINVHDLDRARKFYSEVLELEQADHNEELGWSEFKLPVPNVMLGLNRTTEKLTQGSTSLNFNVNNVDETDNILKSKGVHVDDIQEIPNMVSIFKCKDSEGNDLFFAGQPRIKK